MKKLLFLMSTLLAIGSLFAQPSSKADVFSLPYIENFEDGTTGNVTTNMNLTDGALAYNVWSWGQSEATTPLVGSIESSSILMFDYRILKYASSNAFDPADFTDAEVTIDIIVKKENDSDYNDTIFTVNKDNHISSTDYSSLSISLSDYAGQNISVKIYGSIHNLVESPFSTPDVDVYIDQMAIITPITGVELTTSSISIPKMVSLNDTVPVQLKVLNNSSEDFEGDFDVTFTCSNGFVKDSTLTNASIPAYGSATINWEELVIESIGNYNVKAVITAADDQFVDNDTVVSDSFLVDRVVLIGTDDYNSLYPFNFYYSNCVTQSLYYSSELGTPKMIYSLEYLYTKGSDFGYDQPVKIWIGTTSQNDMTTPINVDTASFKLVYEGLANDIFTESGYVTIPFNEPFLYNNGNIVVTVQNVMTSSYASSHNFAYNEDPQDRQLCYTISSDVNTIDPEDLPLPDDSFEASTNNHNTNIIFNYTDIPATPLVFTVTDKATELPIVGAPLLCNSEVKLTDTLGQVAFALSAAEYNYSISTYGYYDTASTVDLGYDSTHIAIALTAKPEFDVTFKVTESRTGKVLPNTVVSLYEFTDTTDSQGNVTFSMVEGTYNYEVTRYNHFGESGSVTVVDKAVSVSLELDYTNIMFYDNFANFLEKWTSVDNDGDGYNWTFYAIYGPIDGNLVAASDAHDDNYENIDPDNYLITPEIYIDSTDLYHRPVIDFFIGSHAPDNPYEEYKIVVSTTGSTIEDFNNGVVVLEDTIQEYGQYGYGFYNKVVDLSAFEGESINIAVVHTGGQFRLIMDAFKVLIEDFVPEFETTFNVFDKNSNPIADASISINETSITTNENGIADILLADGSYDYLVTAFSYADSKGLLTVSGTTVDIDVKLTRLYEITYNVMSDDNTPIANASISINDTIISTDENGTVSIMLPDGSYDYDVTAYGYDGAEGELVVNEADTVVDIDLVRIFKSASITVTGKGAPVADASISINDNELTTDENGTATILLPDGSYDYSITADGYVDYDSSLTISGTDIDINVELTGLYKVAFKAKSNDGTAVANATIAINNTSLTTDESGNALIELIDGSYNLSVTAEGYDTLTDTVEVDGEDVSMEITLVKTVGVLQAEGLSVKVYPNPATDRLYIRGNYDEGAVASLFSVNGEKILQVRLSTGVSFIDVSDYEKGFYIMEISSKNNKESFRVVVN